MIRFFGLCNVFDGRNVVRYRITIDRQNNRLSLFIHVDPSILDSSWQLLLSPVAFISLHDLLLRPVFATSISLPALHPICIKLGMQTLLISLNFFSSGLSGLFAVGTSSFGIENTATDSTGSRLFRRAVDFGFLIDLRFDVFFLLLLVRS